MTDKTALIAEIEGHRAHFAGRNEGARKRWRRVIMRLHGDPSGISDLDLAEWLKDARQWKWKRGMQTLPKVIDFLSKGDGHAETASEEQVDVGGDRDGDRGGGGVERVAADVSECKCPHCHRDAHDIVPGSCEMRRDCIGAKKVEGLAFVNLTFHGPFLVFETPDPTQEHDYGGIPWVTGEGRFQYRDERSPDWIDLDLSAVPGRHVPPYIGQDAHAVSVPPWCKHFRLRMRWRNSDWHEAAMSRHPPDRADVLEMLWQKGTERGSYQAFGDRLALAMDVNWADRNGDTLAHRIARSRPDDGLGGDPWNRYAWLMSLCNACGVDLKAGNNAGETVIDAWRANTADLALMDGHAIILRELEEKLEEMEGWPLGDV